MKQEGQARADGTADGRRWRPYQIYLIILLTAVSASNYMDRMIVAILQEQIKMDLVLTDTQLGLLIGPAFALFYSAAGIPVARYAERVDRRKLLTGVIALWSAMTAACGLASNFILLAACRLGVGMGEGGCIPIAHSLISDYFSKAQRGMAMAIYSTSAPIAGIVVPIIGAWVAQVYGWRVAFFAVGLPGILLAILVWRTLREPRFNPDADGTRLEVEEAQAFKVDAKWLFGNKAFLFHFIAGAFGGIGNYGMSMFLVSFFTRVHDFTLVQAGSVIAANGVMGLIGTFIGGYFADKYASTVGRSYPIVCGVGVFIAYFTYTASVLVSGWILALTLVLIANIGTDFKNGPAFALVQNIVPVRMRATAAAIFMFGATLIGSGGGPLFVGALSDFLTQMSFIDGLNYHATCPGGTAIAGVSATVAEACETASAQGLRRAMACNCIMYVFATIFYFLAARALKAPSAQSGEGQAA